MASQDIRNGQLISSTTSSGSLSIPGAYIETTGNTGFPDPDKLLPLHEDFEEKVDGDVLVETGAIQFFRSFIEGKNWAYFNGSSRLELTGGNVADFRQTGDFTFACIFERYNSTTQGNLFCLGHTASDLELYNSTISGQVAYYAVGFDGLQAFHEYGDGINANHQALSKLSTCQRVACVIQRTGNKYKFWANKAYQGEVTIANATTGGTSAVFSIGAFPLNGVDPFHGCMGSMAWWWSALTETQCFAIMDQLLGS